MTIILFLFIISELVSLKYTDPANRLPSCYQDYANRQLNQPLLVLKLENSAEADSNLIAVIINDSLYPQIESSVNQYLIDLSNEGFCTVVYRVLGGTPEDLRNILIGELPNDLQGVLLVGDLPIAWWENGLYGEDCPVDLFFADLDGYWNDANSNGLFDQHSSGSGDPQPEIWVGRLYCSQLTYGSQANLLNRYFQKNHLYRTGNLTLPYRGLVYNEVQFYPNNHGMSNLFTDITMINDENTTTAYDYKQKLVEGFHFIFLCAHSSCWAHTFFLQYDQFGGGSVFNFEIPFVDPHSFFYFLNCCMSGRFTETDNLANWYLFTNSYSQAVIASSKLMYGINTMYGFFQDLNNQLTLGDAFKNWHSGNYYNFMGTLILGDPSLKMLDNSSVRIINPDPQYSRVVQADWTEYQVETSNFVNGHPNSLAGDNKLWIFWDSGRIVRGDIFGCYFNQGNFTQPESIAWHEYYDFYAATVEDSSGRVWVAWQSFRDYSQFVHFNIYTSYYYNGNWSSPQYVLPLGGWHDVQPSLASGGDDRVWVVFKSFRNGNSDIYVSSALSGGSWSSSIPLTNTSQDETDPVVIVDNNNQVWVFWTRSQNGYYQIFGDKFDGSWQGTFQVTSGNYDHCRPQAAVGDDSKIWLTWHSWINNQAEICCCRHDSTGWTSSQTITNDPGNDMKPVVTVDMNNNPWIGWMSNRDGNYNIYYSSFNNGWSVPRNLTDDPGNDIDPDIESLNDDIWITWATDRNDYWNIYAASTCVADVEEQPVVNITIDDISLKYSIQNNIVLFSAPSPYQVFIYTVDGRLIDEIISNHDQYYWQTDKLPSGIYFVVVKTYLLQRCFKLQKIN